MKNLVVPVLLLTFSLLQANEPPVVPLWPGDAPGSEGRAHTETGRVTPHCTF